MDYETITFGSITEAQKAKRILRKNGIDASVVRVDPKRSESGCSYGLKYRRENGFAVAKLLYGLGLHYASYREKR